MPIRPAATASGTGTTPGRTHCSTGSSSCCCVITASASSECSLEVGGACRYFGRHQINTHPRDRIGTHKPTHAHIYTHTHAHTYSPHLSSRSKWQHCSSDVNAAEGRGAWPAAAVDSAATRLVNRLTSCGSPAAISAKQASGQLDMALLRVAAKTSWHQRPGSTLLARGPHSLTGWRRGPRP